MPSCSPLRVACLGTLATILAGALPAPAGAVDSSPVDFELSPAGAGSYPRLAAAPGQTARGAVRLRSRVDRPQTLRLQALDLETARVGGIEFRPGRPRATAAWMTLARKDVRLPAHASRIVRFTVRVPAGAAPGEHYGGIVALDRSEMRRARRSARGKGVEVRHVSRIALPVRLWLPGPARRSLAAGGASFAVDAAGSRLDLDLQSTGQRLVRSAAVDLRVSRAGGPTLFAHRGTLSEIVPRTRIRYPIAWRGRPAPGDYRVRGTITPRGAPVVRVDETVTFRGKDAERAEARTGAPGPAAPPDDLPIVLIAALAAALLFGATTAAGYLRLRRRLSAAA